MLIVFGTKQMLSRLDDFKLSLLGKELTPRDSVTVGDLGIYVDPQLSYMYIARRTYFEDSVFLRISSLSNK